MKDILSPEELLDRIRHRHEGVYPDQVDAEVLDQAGCMAVLLPVLKDPVARARHLADILAQLCRGLQCGNERFSTDLVALSASLSYLLNSASCHDGCYHLFDRKEIGKRMRGLARQEYGENE